MQSVEALSFPDKGQTHTNLSSPRRSPQGPRAAAHEVEEAPTSARRSGELRVSFVRTIARGPMAMLLEARRGSARFAVKAASLPSDPRDDERIRREAIALSSIDHPNVVRSLDPTPERRDPPCIIMPLLVGHTLRDELVRRGPLSAARAKTLFLQFLAGLSAIHRAGLTHRDLKPSNLFIGREWDESSRPARGILLDLGLALATGGAGTTGPFVTGAPRYMAPEQWLGGPIDERTDLWMLGLTMLEALTGQAPRARDALELDPEATSSLLAGLPPSAVAFHAVLARATRPRPRDRFASAAEFSRALAAVEIDPALLGLSSKELCT